MKTHHAMGPRERLKRIRESKSWTERLDLAKDHLPGTPFDSLISHLTGALRTHELFPPAERNFFSSEKGIDVGGMARDTLEGFGIDLTRAIQTGESGLFHRLADAIDAWHSHKPMEDKMRYAIIRFCIPPHRVFSVRKIIHHLVDKKILPAVILEKRNADQRIVYGRRIRQLCAELKIRTDQKAGAPRNADKKPSKSVS